MKVEICPNFYSGLFKNFLASIGSVFKFLFDTPIIFLKKLIFSNFLCFISYCASKNYFTETPVFSKFVPKFHKFYSEFCQTQRIFTPLPFFNLRYFEVQESFLENLLKILINNYLEIELNFTNN